MFYLLLGIFGLVLWEWETGGKKCWSSRTYFVRLAHLASSACGDMEDVAMPTGRALESRKLSPEIEPYSVCKC